MNLVTFLIPCVTILVQQAIGQEEAYKKYSCDNEDIKKYIIDRHNELRAQVNPSARNMLQLEWDEEAAANAARWANQCQNCHSKADQREITTFGCGENLYMTSRLHSWAKVIQGWWDEHKDFEYGVGAKSDGAITGHYTQFVWYRSYKCGCAVAYCPKMEHVYFYVCQYCPAGNIQNIINTPYLVGDPCADCEHHCVNGLCVNPCTHIDNYEDCPTYHEMCDSSEEDMPEDCRIKKICKETCYCDDEIH